MDFTDIPEGDNDGGIGSLPEPEADDALRYSNTIDIRNKLILTILIFNSAFNKQFQAKIEAKRAQEFEAEKVVKSKALEELANWNTQRDIRLKAKKDTNRTEEQSILEALETEVDASNIWERVTKLVDVSQEVPTESTKADTTRMRKLFIQLKNEPISSSA